MSTATLLEVQLERDARDLEAWLRKYAGPRFHGLERVEDLGDGAEWSACVRFARRELGFSGRMEEKPYRVWFLGRTPLEALTKAKTTTREQLQRDGVRSAR